MSEPKDQSGRLPRRRTLKNGRIVFNDRNSTIDCTVHNLSKNGALLPLPNVAGYTPGDGNADLHGEHQRGAVGKQRHHRMMVAFGPVA